MENFRKVLDLCNLHEQQYEGDPYTLIRGRHNVNAIQERLDWCFVNDQWQGIFKPITTYHLDYFMCDHRAISVNILPLAGQNQTTPRYSRFKFEKIWLNDTEASDLILKNWQKNLPGSAVENLCTNIQSCTSSPQLWHHQKDYVIHKATTMEKAEFETLVCLMWSIWNDRNCVLHGGTSRAASALVTQAITYLDKYRLAKPRSREKQQPILQLTNALDPAALNQQQCLNPGPSQQCYNQHDLQN
uniref:Uncharacterized protein n=1 Tax=Cannabis sativa TaxID=3483 RepID=A0A803QCT6_CANSA